MIVVGVDGSEGGATALEFAAAEAALRETRLRIVSAWEVPPAAGFGGDFGPSLDVATWDALRVRAQKVADDAFAAVKKLQPSLEGEALAVQGRPADVGRPLRDVPGRRPAGAGHSLLIQPLRLGARVRVLSIRPARTSPLDANARFAADAPLDGECRVSLTLMRDRDRPCTHADIGI